MYVPMWVCIWMRVHVNLITDVKSWAIGERGGNVRNVHILYTQYDKKKYRCFWLSTIYNPKETKVAYVGLRMFMAAMPDE